MNKLFLIMHYLGMALVLGSSTSMFLILLTSKNSTQEEKKTLMGILRRAMKPVGPIGILLLLISGGYLSIPLWAFLKTNGLFHLKLTLVGALIFLLVVNRFRKKQSGEIKVPFPFPMVISFLIIILAVLIFN